MKNLAHRLRDFLNVNRRLAKSNRRLLDFSVFWCKMDLDAIPSARIVLNNFKGEQQ